MNTKGNVFVVGTSGSGKSTAAKLIAWKLNRKHVEIDALMWLPNWIKRDAYELASLIRHELVNGPVVVDGNFASKGIYPSPGDILVFLDYPRWLVISRLVRRSLTRVAMRKKLWSGNKEEFRFLISRDPELNPVLHAFRTHSERRLFYTTLLGNSIDTTNYVIKTSKQLRQLIIEL